MTHYVQTVTKDNASVRIEVEDTSKPTPGFSRPSAPADVSTEAAREAYSQTLDTIRVCANGLIDTIQGLEAPPSTASIDFSIKIDAEAGALVAKSRDEGQFRVSLSWKQAEPEESDSSA